MKKILIAASGTGGHVFPALSLAECFRKHQIQTAWVGTVQGLENQISLPEDITLYHISAKGLRRKGFLSWLVAPFWLIQALYQAIRIIWIYRPNQVIGMGGFVSGPVCLAAWLLRKQVIIHEQNAIPGLTNRILYHFADLVFTGFPQTFPSAAQVYSVGNPVRSDIRVLSAIPRFFAAQDRPFHLLIIGGSQGAAVLNQYLPEALVGLNHPIDVWHQTGEKNFNATKEAYESKSFSAKVAMFIRDMAAAYAWADLVICRAGALTIAELCAAGLPSILIPYPFAADDHQTANARFMADHEAAILLPQAQCDAQALNQLLSSLVIHPERLQGMGESAKGLVRGEVAEEMLKIIQGENS